MSRATAAERVERILSILPHLATVQGETLTDIAARFDVDPDELREDLELCFYRVGVHPFTPDALVDVLIDEEDDTVTVNFGDWFRRPLRLTPEEALYLLAAGRARLRSEGTDQDPVLASAVEKLAAVTGERGDAVDVHLGEADEDVLRTVRDAVEQGLRLRLDYYSHGRDVRTTREVSPWALRSEGGHWYLTGHCHEAAGRRVFRVDRIASATPIGEPAEPAPADSEADLDLDLAGSAASVELVVPASSSWVADAYPTEDVTRLDDGRLRVVLRVAATPWLERLLLRLPADVEARELGSGASLATLRADAADRVLARYR